MVAGVAVLVRVWVSRRPTGSKAWSRVVAPEAASGRAARGIPFELQCRAAGQAGGQGD